MLTINDRAYQLCDGLTRREWLRIGSLGLAGLSWPGLLQARSGATTPAGSFGKAKACILLYMFGGPPQHETWDPKPDAPAEIRGDLNSISTIVPGLRVGELMPQLARLADKYCVLRAVSTDDNRHGGSRYAMFTGTPYQGDDENAKLGPPNDWPSMNAVVKWLQRGRSSLPAAVTLPGWGNSIREMPGEGAGFLGRRFDPWLLECDPAAADFHIPELQLAPEVPPPRFDERRSLLEQINRHVNALERTGAVGTFDDLSQQAFDLLRSPQARRAFDLQQEPAAVRDRYGPHKFAQSVLLARRLVEAGVPLVEVNWPRTTPADSAWDTHSDNTRRLKTLLMPPMDQACSALLEDLAVRGLLEQTLVIWMGEFGRTPKLNARRPDGRAPGRDHWGHVFSVMLAGGGIRGGQVHGVSDRIGGYPKDGRVEPGDLTATIFHCLGYPAETEIRDALGRGVPISRGQVVQQLF